MREAKAAEKRKLPRAVVCEKPAKGCVGRLRKGADAAKSGRVRECYIRAKLPKATVCKETAKAYSAKSENRLLAVTDVDEEL